MRFPAILLFAAVLALGGCSQRDDTQCLPPRSYSNLLRFRLVDTSGTDLLAGGTAGIRIQQPCRNDSLQAFYTLYYDSDDRDSATILGFYNLQFPRLATGDARAQCFRILFDFPSGDQDTVTWSYHTDEHDACRSPIIDEVRFNGVNAVLGGPSVIDRQRYYKLVKR